jgi:hypothetical protein
MRIPRSAFILAALAALCAGRASVAAATQDVFIGAGSAGPFQLSYKNILPGTDTVQVDSLDETRGIDYTIDPVGGSITFSKPLALQSAAVVSYEYNPATAVPNGPGLALPLSLDLARTSSGALSLTALYQQNASAPAGDLALGLGGNWNASDRTQLSSKFYYAPPAEDADDPSGDNASDRLGLSLGAQQQVDRYAQLSFGFVRVGSDFGAAGAAEGLIPGQQTWTFGGQLTPAKHLVATVNYTQQDSLTDITPSDGKLATTMTYTPSSKVAVATTINQTDQGGTNVSQQNLSLTVTPQSTLKLNTGIAVQESQGIAATTASVGGTVQPSPVIELSAAYRDRTAPPTDPNPADTLDTSVAQMTIAPLKSVKLTGSYAQNPDTNGVDPQHAAQQGLALQTQLGSFTVSGACNWLHPYSTPGMGTTMQVDLGLHVTRHTLVTGGYQQTMTGIGADSSATNFYTFGLTHNLGDSLSVSLNGTMQQGVGATVVAPVYTATANVGVKF